MNVTDQLRACLANPNWLPFQLDLTEQKVLLVRLEDQQIREAAFLDQRILKPGTDGFWIRLEDFQRIVPPPARIDGLFHVGHCGSTLVSRMLGDISLVRALREPMVMRELARVEPGTPDVIEHWLPIMLAWLARPGADEKLTHVKFTSACANLLPYFIGANGKAVALFTNLENYLASASRGGGTATDIAAFASQRHMEWEQLCPGAPAPSTPEEQAACGWLVNMNCFVQATISHPDRLMMLRFEDWLKDVNESMSILADHHGVILPERDWSQHQLLRRYAKQTEVPYDAAARTADLQLAQQLNGRFIQNGLNWARAQSAFLPHFHRLEPWLGDLT